MTNELTQAAQVATARGERLKQEAADRMAKGIEPGCVLFEYTVNETEQSRENRHDLIQHLKGSRETLPRAVALRKQGHGLGFILGEDQPVSPAPEPSGIKSFTLTYNDGDGI